MQRGKNGIVIVIQGRHHWSTAITRALVTSVTLHMAVCCNDEHFGELQRSRKLQPSHSRAVSFTFKRLYISQTVRAFHGHPGSSVVVMCAENY